MGFQGPTHADAAERLVETRSRYGICGHLPPSTGRCPIAQQSPRDASIARGRSGYVVRLQPRAAETLPASTFPLLCFDWHEEQFHHRLDSLHQQLGLTPVPADQRFYTRELRKQMADLTETLPKHILQLYHQLEEIANRV